MCMTCNRKKWIDAIDFRPFALVGVYAWSNHIEVRVMRLQALRSIGY